jgi:hypothetical protein
VSSEQPEEQPVLPPTEMSFVAVAPRLLLRLLLILLASHLL